MDTFTHLTLNISGFIRNIFFNDLCFSIICLHRSQRRTMPGSSLICWWRSSACCPCCCVGAPSSEASSCSMWGSTPNLFYICVVRRLFCLVTVKFQPCTYDSLLWTQSDYFVDFKYAESNPFSFKTHLNTLQTAPKRKLIIIINVLLQFFCFDHGKATRLQSGNLVMKERVAQRNRMTQCQAVVTDNTLMLN